MSNSDCYDFKEYKYDNGLFNNSTDATYIIHLEGNGRLPDIQKQLEIYKPTNIVYIVFNKGYKKCKKELKKQNSMYDIIDVNISIFNHSRKNNFSNILILEDDFLFSPEIKNETHLKNINTFITHNKDKSLIYHIGSLPMLVIPYDLYTYRGIQIFAMHASIFTKGAIDTILNNKDKINDWDIYLLDNVPRYMYHKPLCNQLITETENKGNWDHGTILKFISNSIISLFKLDKQTEPGTSYIYMISKILSLLLVILFIVIIYFILSYLKVTKFIARSLKKVRSFRTSS